MDKLTIKKFLNSNTDIQNEIINTFKIHFYNLLSKDEIENIMNISDKLYKYIKSTYNLKLSKEEVLKKRKRTCLEKYGCDNIAKAESIKQKIKNTCLEKYGYASAISNNDVKQKSKQTKLDRYGDENYNNRNKISNALSNKTDEEWDNINLKRKQNMLEKYGDKCYYNYDKCKETWKNKSNDNLNDINSKRKQTKLEKYGNENYNNGTKISYTLSNKSNTEWSDIINKRKETCLDKYNVESFSKTLEFKKLIHDYNSDLNMKNKRLMNMYKSWNNKTSDDKKIIKEKIRKTNLEKYGVPYYCMTDECRKLNGQTVSQKNKQFAELLINNNIEFQQEFPLENKSFDFKVNDKLIEINPTYTHNSTYGTHFSGFEGKPLDKNYHLEKSKLAQENGYFCIHVWDWDNWDKIINLISPKKKIYARNCELKEVNKKECDMLVNLYHLQNTCNGQTYRYGIYYDDKLIQIMTFGKPRYNKKYEFELLRLCSHKDYKIIGGSEKLFKHFIRELNPKSIISYCDNSKFSGDVYKRLGMKLINQSSPACIWSKGNIKITDNLLRQRGFDQLFGTNYGKGTSNHELILNNGFAEVYDCGQKIFEYIK